jgi:hypothetical protein
MNVALTEKQFDLIVDHNQLINEAWYNTVLDIVGWADPTGIADTVNGISYMVQGDYLFGFLSFVSAIPYAGDIIAKPVLHALKIGKPSAKALNKVMALSKAGKTAEAAKALQDLTNSNKLINGFVIGVSKHFNKLEQLVMALPGGVLKGFRETILGWLKLFKNASKSGVVTKRFAKGFEKLSQKEQLRRLEHLKKVLSSTGGAFSGYKSGSKFFSKETLWSGMPQILVGNRSVRALMRKSKWYLGLLDFMGVGNFVGPDELIKQVGVENFQKEVARYNQTPESEQYFSDEFGKFDETSEKQPESKTTTQQTTTDPLQLMINQLFPI